MVNVHSATISDSSGVFVAVFIALLAFDHGLGNIRSNFQSPLILVQQFSSHMSHGFSRRPNIVVSELPVNSSSMALSVCR